jgi:XTP/dITP diphosphohydrolase
VKLVFATNNNFKFTEMKESLSTNIELQKLEDIGCREELPETKETLEGNAEQKARYVYEKFGYSCFADDTGLEINALDGKPGVYSARYAGESKDSMLNMKKVLEEMKNERNRSARFRTVIALIISGETMFFEGLVEGQILHELQGDKGFGYDPIFLPDNHAQSFAQMNLQEKNAISHRGKAVRQLVKYLNMQYSK